MRSRYIPPRQLTIHGAPATVEGGTEGSVQSQTAAASSAAPLSALVVTLDTCLDALADMFAAAVFPDQNRAREKLDKAYETLVTSLENFREAVPKA